MRLFGTLDQVTQQTTIPLGFLKWRIRWRRRRLAVRPSLAV